MLVNPAWEAVPDPFFMAGEVVPVSKLSEGIPPVPLELYVTLLVSIVRSSPAPDDVLVHVDPDPEYDDESFMSYMPVNPFNGRKLREATVLFTAVLTPSEARTRKVCDPALLADVDAVRLNTPVV